MIEYQFVHVFSAWISCDGVVRGCLPIVAGMGA